MARAHGSDPTVNRIVAAATAEFARYGIAGARIERIATSAQTSKERVYAHFRGKEALYRFVANKELAAMEEAVELDPSDLPGYAGRLFDLTRQHPERHRLMLWGQLEAAHRDVNTGSTREPNPVYESLRVKLRKIRAAQSSGTLDARWVPDDVLVFVTQLATSWATQSHLVPDEIDHKAFFAERRAAIVAAVQCIFPTRVDTAHRPSA